MQIFIYWFQWHLTFLTKRESTLPDKHFKPILCQNSILFFRVTSWLRGLRHGPLAPVSPSEVCPGTFCHSPSPCLNCQLSVKASNVTKILKRYIHLCLLCAVWSKLYFFATVSLIHLSFGMSICLIFSIKINLSMCSVGCVVDMNPSRLTGYELCSVLASVSSSSHF